MRFDYVKYDQTSQDEQNGFKNMVEQIAHRIEDLGPGRAQSLALTKLEECYMWIGKALRDTQVDRRGVE